MIHLFAMPGSGNSYKVQLLCSLLDIQTKQTDMSALDGSTQSEDYLAKNPIGKLPLLKLEDGRYLPESGAILHYLASGTDFLPSDSYDHAMCLSWIFFEQYSHEPAIAVRRSISLYPERAAQATPELMASLLEKGNKALGVMETQLQKSPFLTGDTPTIADIALFGYSHDCHKGGFDLGDFPGIQAWIKRIEGLPGYLAMPLG
ncbi:MAG: glutathione S-transferase family protein [Rhizobiales bacterium]|nr:glutathione S-transferase family protein [Hyphomicrobiales bacterium]